MQSDCSFLVLCCTKCQTGDCVADFDFTSPSSNFAELVSAQLSENAWSWINRIYNHTGTQKTTWLWKSVWNWATGESSSVFSTVKVLFLSTVHRIAFAVIFTGLSIFPRKFDTVLKIIIIIILSAQNATTIWKTGQSKKENFHLIFIILNQIKLTK